MEDGGKAHTMDIEEAEFADRLEEMLASGNPLQIGMALRYMTGEYGVTSKRPRRIGAFDAVQFAQAAEINEVTHVVLAKLDCLNLFAKTEDGMIPYVVGYEIDGVEIDYIPVDEKTLRRVKPIFGFTPAFEEDITDARERGDLPSRAKTFLRKIEQRMDRRVNIAGVGPGRDQLIYLAA